MPDLKLQAYRGEATAQDWDFRKSTGGFKGSPEDEHRTLAEQRISDEIAAELPDAIVYVNNLLEGLEVAVPDLAPIPGSGPVKLALRVFDND